MKIVVRGVEGTPLEIDAEPDWSVAFLKRKILDLTKGSCGTPVHLSYGEKELKDDRSLASYGIKGFQPLMLGIKFFDKEGDKIVIQSTDKKKKFYVEKLHISCRSDVWDRSQNLTGLALWLYKGQQDWRLNCVHCKSGYIYCKHTKNIDHIHSNEGMVHGKLYKSLFGEDPQGKVLATGFAYKDGEWKFNSRTFNYGSEYQDDSYVASDHEGKAVFQAYKIWLETGRQNISPSELKLD